MNTGEKRIIMRHTKRIRKRRGGGEEEEKS
jgi:hypothetical protein